MIICIMNLILPQKNSGTRYPELSSSEPVQPLSNMLFAYSIWLSILRLEHSFHTMNEKWVFRIAYIRMNDFSLAIFTNKFVTDMDSLHLLLTTNHTGSILCNYHILHLLLHGYTLLSSNRITSPLHL